jgi:hypothetical protein
VPAGGLGEEVLDRAVPGGFPDGHLVAVAHADDAEVFRQADQSSAGSGGFGNQRSAIGEVALHLRAGHGLYRGHAKRPGRHLPLRHTRSFRRMGRRFDLRRQHGDPSGK